MYPCNKLILVVLTLFLCHVFAWYHWTILRFLFLSCLRLAYSHQKLIHIYKAVPRPCCVARNWDLAVPFRITHIQGCAPDVLRPCRHEQLLKWFLKATARHSRTEPWMRKRYTAAGGDVQTVQACPWIFGCFRLTCRFLRRTLPFWV